MQGVTRKRWLAVKLGLIGLATVAVSGLLSLMFTWWSKPFDRVNGNQFTSVFDQRGVAPIGYAFFAFVLGVTAGILIRRTLPAMAATLVAFVTTRGIVTFWIRPHLMTPVRTTEPLKFATGMILNQTNNGPLSVIGAKPGAWVFQDNLVGPSGHAVAGSFLEPSKPLRTGLCWEAPGNVGVPTCKSFLGLPVVRDGHLRGSRAGPECRVFLVAPPTHHLKNGRRDHADWDAETQA
jgi:hypothetical protein